MQETGAFRRPLAGSLSAFRRGFQARLAEKEDVRRIDGSIVQPKGNGGEIDIKRIVPVDAESSEVQQQFALGEQRRSSKREKAFDMMAELWVFLGTTPKSMSASAAFLKEKMGHDEFWSLVHSLGFQRLSQVIELFDDSFQMFDNGLMVQRKSD